ncbi:vanadium-dependent haloperoxidase [Mucilaginibacter sp. KACC 22063]|uniref:vanadium-dependent haloperoxidase n=1 Tax=Mucilaginibacter sp. KACC 22063 TaxID=3025666 RepID=UPI002365C8AD|nr:vanadium-dependent haloperoxidase [Mucilaginibacter sp. KACC 22063]WDF57109.1 vanadium-dependent haloperoxidase [Mucilaginibacter sp. KACC 22063]
MKKSIKLVICGLLIVSMGCRSNNHKPLTEREVARFINQMTALMVHDVTNPPLATRFYAYSCLSGYEIVSQNGKSLKPMYGILNGYPKIAKPSDIRGYSTDLSAILAMYKTAETLQPSGYLLKKSEQRLIDSCKSIGFSDETITNSAQYAAYISKAVLAYAKSDRYNKTSNFPRYTPTEKDGEWDPTPPSYMAPVEPYFNTIRPFTLDSVSQFFGEYPIPFSSKKNSVFYGLMLENYKKGANDLTQEEKNIANFWDCNPFAVQATGHMLIGLKKISPGAHWLGIASLACVQQKTGFAKALQVHTVLSIGLMDGFICCWDYKYKTNRIRPETAIRKYIDVNWKPLLQTPPFPEYLSGHSVVSATSAVILSYFLGNNFHYLDNVEAPYGVPSRHFSSFAQAAQEAAVSRFYGGIHFTDAISKGLEKGNNVGNWVIQKYAQTKELR